MALRNTLDFGSTTETKIRSEKVGTEKVVPYWFPGFGGPVQTYDDAKGKPEQIWLYITLKKKTLTVAYH